MRVAVAGTYTKPITNGLNVRTYIQLYDASSEEEAVGLFIDNMAELLPEHSLHCKPVRVSCINDFDLFKKYCPNMANTLLKENDRQKHKLCLSELTETNILNYYRQIVGSKAIINEELNQLNQKGGMK